MLGGVTAGTAPGESPLARSWSPPFPVDVGAVVAPVRRGPGDPSFHREACGAVWLAAGTPCGAGTLRLAVSGGAVDALAWGSGAEWLLDGLPALLGAEDDDSGFVAHHPLVAESRRRRPGVRLCSTGRVWDALLPAVLEQKVTGTEAQRSYRQLCVRFGEVAPGPTPMPLHVPVGPRVVMRLADWEWHAAGVDGARRRTLVAAAQVAHRLEAAAGIKGVLGRELLRKVPGIGVWTAAEVAQRAWGDADAVSFGDFHLAKTVGHALTGGAVDDDGMAGLLAPYSPQRHRAVVFLLLSGVRAPRRGVRFSPRDYRRV
ncbi:DNA-3-methyladenine glycosylase family protein [Actinosynnema mirum]|uniref:3-methyladenine DNA glycosylase/8-oxoguanine DNA glycosylase-like protein n=1 Tax=Actinosynnema mirum (strain ATCC 29888 / DSM 43827 / JCM 3225 / NBRC 14064 / NCIMB 13271 / NRRL B-12336 / IMRU 3971 / 101) TaxID=446462 RepID=C6WJ62_ACTMD|nr:3-methyladenine DNA glycosylase [Actinosynnema mirum]ACU40138.1 3-methyladenine DNA glycosylase/8-oxoguanine DNA glycosylase-like protein [Actinosynnema mirum DSM 43827]